MSAGFKQHHFLRFHNAVNSGKTCIYFRKLFKNDVYAYCRQSFFEKFRRQLKMDITRTVEEVNKRTLRKVARNCDALSDNASQNEQLQGTRGSNVNRNTATYWG
jgi:hypothetical protein